MELIVEVVLEHLVLEVLGGLLLLLLLLSLDLGVELLPSSKGALYLLYFCDRVTVL